MDRFIWGSIKAIARRGAPALFALVALDGCGGGSQNGPPLAPIAALPPQSAIITLTPSATQLSLLPHSIGGISVVAATNVPVSATSSNPSIATVSTLPNGSYVITGIAPGITTVTFAAPGVASVSVTVTVQGPLVLNPSPVTITSLGGQANFTASEIGYNGSYTIVSNSTPGVATVTQTSPGVFTATGVAAGTDTITIADSSGQQQTVTVKVAPIGDPLVLSPSTLTITGLNQTGTFTATDPGYSGAYTVTGNTSPAVATVTQTAPGTFTVNSVSGGTTAITVADSNGNTQTLTATVLAPIVFSPTALTINGVGMSASATASESGYSGNFSIVSNSSPGIASVSQTSPGVFTVTAGAQGTTTITVSDGNGQTQTLNVTVNALIVTPTSLTFSTAPSSQNVTATEAGYAGTFSVITPPNAAIATVTQTVPGTFQVTSVASGSTSMVIGDTLGNQQTVTIGVTTVGITVTSVTSHGK